MGIQISWDNAEHTTVRWEFVGRWTLDNLETSVAANESLLNEATETIDYIFDVTGGGLIPPQLMKFVRQHRHFSPHPMEGMKVVIGADRYLRVFWRELSRYLPDHWQVQFADTYEEARALIRSERYTVVRS